MNRQMKRMQAKQERSAGKQPRRKTAKERAERQAASRGGIRQFIKDVISEMRKVLWPTRQQVINSFVIVTIVVVIMTGFIFGLDQAFQRLVELVYG